MRALSIRQPWAELILRGVKTVEYRSRPTRVVGERFWIYASRQWAEFRGQRSEVRGQAEGVPLTSDLRPLTSSPRGLRPLTSDNLAAAPGPPEWMWDLAERLILDGGGADLPRGLIVGSAVIEHVTPGDGAFTMARLPTSGILAGFCLTLCLVYVRYGRIGSGTESAIHWTMLPDASAR